MTSADARAGFGRPRALEVCVVAAALSGFAYYVRGFWPQMLDDAFISFRYAENLAAGRGIVWNPGSPPVEGFTNFLWVLVMAIPHALGLDVPATARALGIASALASLAVVAAFAARLCEGAARAARGLAAAFAVFVAGVFYPMAAQAVSGMETALFTLLFVSFTYLATFVPERPTRSGLVALPVVALLLGLTRPDGVLVAALGLAAALARIAPDQRLRLIRFSLLLLVLPGAAYFMWRARYFGHWLPISFYVKVRNPSDGTLLGAKQVIPFLRAYGLPLAPLLAVAAWRAPARTSPALVISTLFLVFYLFPVHTMGLQWRFCVPVVPVLAALAGSGLLPLVARWRSARSLQRARLGVVFVLCPLLAFALYGTAYYDISFAESYGAILEGVHVPLARELRKLRGDGPPPRLAISDAGVVPYYSGWESIDMGGLNERSTAAGNPPDAESVAAAQPDLVVIASLHKRLPVVAPQWKPLLEILERAGMERVRVIGGPYYEWLFARPDTELARALVAWQLDWIDPTDQIRRERKARIKAMSPEEKQRLFEGGR